MRVVHAAAVAHAVVDALVLSFAHALALAVVVRDSVAHRDGVQVAHDVCVLVALGQRDALVVRLSDADEHKHGNAAAHGRGHEVALYQCHSHLLLVAQPVEVGVAVRHEELRSVRIVHAAAVAHTVVDGVADALGARDGVRDVVRRRDGHALRDARHHRVAEPDAGAVQRHVAIGHSVAVDVEVAVPLGELHVRADALGLELLLAQRDGVAVLLRDHVPLGDRHAA